MPMPYLRRHERVFVLNLGEEHEDHTENRLTPDWLRQTEACLDEVEDYVGPAALVTTSTGKFYSNGLEPRRFVGPQDEILGYLSEVQKLLARLLAFPMITIAAVQGHAFAGGLLLALTHDLRIMRADRGFLCLPEVDLGFPFPTAMAGLIRGRLPAATAHEAMTTGRRYGGQEALAAGLVDVTASQAELLSAAIQRAEQLADKRGPTLAAIKATLYGDILTGLRQ
ncbi:enoyl-CoA hydratase-related protein [Kribbella ginsengisoli]|uniref:Enoyl-CoA hydratase/isomerase family protein n=1 Tax=Kribbella ginsengisoli TaxID=363865 RepID=A0ABP6YE10_9ACTN